MTATFDESEHPRGMGGRFAAKPGPAEPPKPDDAELGKQWYAKLNASEQMALEEYVSGYNARLVNEVLRSGEARQMRGGDVTRLQQAYATALEKAEPFQPTTVFRGVKKWPRFDEEFRDGRRLRLKGFTSTALIQDDLWRFRGMYPDEAAILEIKTDRGVPVWALEPKGYLSERAGSAGKKMLDVQKEILLGHDWEYEITGSKQDEAGRAIYELRVTEAEGEEVSL